MKLTIPRVILAAAIACAAPAQAAPDVVIGGIDDSPHRMPTSRAQLRSMP
jgi:hypothetical protein